MRLSSTFVKVYILDFGFAHEYKNPDGTHKAPRMNPSKYIGSARYAPRNAYLNRELSRMDDLEMWLYVIVELVKGALPWNAKDIFTYQKSVRAGLGLREFLGGLPIEFIDIMKEVDKLSYADDPNYNEIYGLIGNAILMSGQKVVEIFIAFMDYNKSMHSLKSAFLGFD
ncbi:hypothetical protein OESDEN_01820 [Oesophagostomum dentatum]|uniref:Protein kinase domain-containing protein n=1 Tax=Oesophagostomum dentatum TaxID=61180 RepID=A0A0B1TQ39_OESDE|nr:hypothetical protein OESDEN_01820 [Oesophagostomum dentatum]